MLTIGELAALWMVSRRTIERLIADGRLRVVHLSPRAVRIPRSSAVAYLESLGATSGRAEATVHDLTHLHEGDDRDR